MGVQEALRRGSSDPQARKRWSEEARGRAERDLSWEVVAGRFEALVHRAMQDAAERRRSESRNGGAVSEEQAGPEAL